eukprot:Ihof_evm3s663 gene=Ihof_evmTU3s663
MSPILPNHASDLDKDTTSTPHVRYQGIPESNRVFFVDILIDKARCSFYRPLPKGTCINSISILLED